MLFSAATAEYMADKQKRLRATTLEGYRSAIRCHLMPQWGEREIETIAFEEVQDWVDSFDFPGAAEKAYKTFRQIYRWILRRHQLAFWGVFRGAKAGVKYSFVLSVNGTLQGKMEATSICMAVHL